MRLCDCGCGLPARNAESDAHPGHEAAVWRMRVAEHKAHMRFLRSLLPKVNGKAARKARAKARKSVEG